MKNYKEVLDKYNNSNKKFEFICSGPTDGISKMDDVVIKRCDYRTKENYQIAKDCGFNCLHLGNNILPHQLEMGKPGEITLEEFKAKNDKALEAMNSVGFDTIIMSDYRYTNSLSRKQGGLIGDDKPFKSEEELDEFIKKCTSWYKDYPGVNGIDVGDEPTWWGLESFGQIYKSLKRIYPNHYLFYNFFGFGISEETENSIGNFEVKDNETYYEAAKKQYQRYLDKILECMGDLDYMRFDAYPVCPDKLSEYYFECLNLVSNYTRDHNMKLALYLPAFEMLHYGTLRYSKLTKRENDFCHNLALAFGVKSIEHFTYTTGRESKTRGETFIDGGSPITLDNKKTEIFDYIEESIKNIRNIEKIIMNFEYRGYRTYISDVHNGSVDHLKLCENTYSFKKVNDFECNKECMLVSELYDKENDNFIYSLVNISDTKINSDLSKEIVKIQFDEDVIEVVELHKGNKNIIKLNNHQYIKELDCGDAAFLLV